MKLIRPEGKLTQPFAANYNDSYKNSGLKGHSGEDYVLGFKKEIKASVTGEVYSILNAYNPNPNKYRAVFQLVDDGQFVYEVSYGHIDTALCEEGQIVEAGQPIATEGNWGTCYVGGKLVTPEEKPSGKGSHLHFQVRKCIKVKKRSAKKQYLRNSEGFLKRGDYFFEVVDYTNGYNGCISPEQFYSPSLSPEPQKHYFTKDLQVGDRGEEVKKLQDALKRLNVFPNNIQSTGYFGKITKSAVISFQNQFKDEILKPAGLTQGTGYFGEHTRNFLNTLI